MWQEVEKKPFCDFQLDLMCRTYMLVQIFMAFPIANEHLLHTLIPGVPIMIFGFYFWDVVYSVYRDVKREETENNTATTSGQEMKTEA